MKPVSKSAIVVAAVHAAWLALTAPATAYAQTAEKVWVHIDSSDAAQLQQDTTGDRRHWETVCSSP